MIPLLTAKNSTQLDRFYIQNRHIPGLVLMERAASAVCHEIFRDFPHPCSAICIAGKGNNGGDALAVARILQTHGYTVRVGILSEELPPDAQSNLLYFLHTGQAEHLSEESLDNFFSKPADFIVDGVFGIGLHREPRGIYAKTIAAINQCSAYKYAIDIPSGVFADSGHATLAVQANKTITFSYPKLGQLLYPGKSYTGQLVVAPIAPSLEEMSRDQCSAYWVDSFPLPKRKEDTHKGTYGKVAILAGSKSLGGAAVLCTKAAVSGGAGIVYHLGCEYTVHLVRQSVPSAIAQNISEQPDCFAHADVLQLLDHQYHAIVLGPGIGTDPCSHAAVQAIAASDLPKVLDADALNILSSLKNPIYGNNTVITPHPGEFARLTGKPIQEILDDPLSAAQAYAKKHHICVLLKGAVSIVTDGTDTYIITAGTPGMAKGGSGDVLSGVIGAFLAQGMPLLQSAYGAAYLCGKAAELAASQYSTYAMTPEHTIEYLGQAILNE